MPKAKSAVARPGVKIIDLDAVKPRQEVVVKLNGQQHPLVPVSINDYIENTRLIQKFAESGDHDEIAQFEMILDIVDRAFPTIGKAALRELNLEQVQYLAGFARNGDGTNEFERQASEAQASEGQEEGNPQKAG